MSQKGMGIDALDWDILIAWSERFYSETIIEWVKNPENKRHKAVPIVLKYCTLPDIDLQIIRQMSQEYCWMASEATDPLCICPIDIDVEGMSEVEEEVRADDIMDRMRAIGFQLD